ncbi:MAG: hypothetical protein AB1705_02200 [Verrucomicrobiota bacterium]
MNARAARICLGLAIAMFVMGLMMLCYCAGWFALTAILAGVAVRYGTGSMRWWAVFWLFASLVMTAVHAVGEFG